MDLIFLAGRLVGIATMVEVGAADAQAVAEALRSIATELEQAAERVRDG